MRVLLFTGKGGVGKTTAAAATGVHAARCGVKTLVMSTDSAHSLADVLDRGVGPHPEEIEPSLFAQHADARSRGDRSWRAVQEYVLGVLDTLGVDRLEAEELTAMPGAEEVLALLEVRDQVMHGPWDLVVVDCAPTADTLRLLSLPELLGRTLDRLLPVQRRVVRALAHGGRPLLSRAGGIGVPQDHVVEAATRLQVELAGARDVLTAPGTSIRLVLTPEAVAVAEALRTWTTLSLYGYLVDGVVANRVVDGAGGDAWRAGWAAAQALTLAQVEESFGQVPIRRVPFAACEPVGADALAAVGVALHGPAGAAAAQALLAPASMRKPMHVERHGQGYRLAIDLPAIERSELELTRTGEELTIVAAGRRRVISLPSALRRCRVTGASLRDGSLSVGFEPDPDLWRQH